MIERVDHEPRNVAKLAVNAARKKWCGGGTGDGGTVRLTVDSIHQFRLDERPLRIQTVVKML